jgi:hypothetical protein
MKQGTIQTAYPLTPVQEGMLYHELRDHEPGVYLIQYECVLRGELDEPRFAQAWRETLASHAALRTLLSWENRERPLQVVVEAVEPEISSLDWVEKGASVRQALWEDWLERDRARGFVCCRRALCRRRFAAHSIDRGWQGGQFGCLRPSHRQLVSGHTALVHRRTMPFAGGTVRDPLRS